MIKIILRRIYEMKAKSPNQMGQIWSFFYPMVTNCVHAKNDVGQNCSLFGKKNIENPIILAWTRTMQFRQP